MSKLDTLADEWDRWAVTTPSPFLTHAWLSAWWTAFGRGRRLLVLVRARDGAPAGGAVLTRHWHGALAAPVNDHSGDWAVVGRDAAARRDAWTAIAELAAPAVTLAGLVDPEPARTALELRGRRVFASAGTESPFLLLPRSFDDLLEAGSRNLRSQVGRRRRGLERQGRLRFRTTTGGAALAKDLDAFLRVEAAGWKARAGTAILSDPRTERLYREFASAAAARGWLRLHLLELDGVPIAGDLGCAIGGSAFLLKTGFDEAHAHLSPGLVLRAEALRASVDEGLADYDFLGGPDPYKLRWASTVRTRTTLRAFGRRGGALADRYRHWARPALVRARAALRHARG